jgi:hypothetical protein
MFLFAAIPPVTYAASALKELSLPHGLFDEKTPVDTPSPLDAFMPIIAAKSENDGLLIVVDGCKCFKRMLEEKVEHCVCGVVDGLLAPISIGLLRVFLNQKRTLSIRESVCFFRWLSEHCAGKRL